MRLAVLVTMSQYRLVSLDKGNLPTNGSGCSNQQTFVGEDETDDEPQRTSEWEAMLFIRTARLSLMCL